MGGKAKIMSPAAAGTPNYSLYEKASGALMEILREYTPGVEQYSIDEAFFGYDGYKRTAGKS